MSFDNSLKNIEQLVQDCDVFQAADVHWSVCNPSGVIGGAHALCFFHTLEARDAQELSGAYFSVCPRTSRGGVYVDLLSCPVVEGLNIGGAYLSVGTYKRSCGARWSTVND